MPMQKYVSHKEVHAAEIDRIEVDGLRTAIYFKDAEPVSYTYSIYEKMVTRYRPVKGDFLVIYPDGYQSFSPAKAFLDGYSKI